MYNHSFVTRNPFTPVGLWHCIGLGNTSSVFVPHRDVLVFGIRQCHRLSGNRVVRLFMPAAGARPKENKIT